MDPAIASSLVSGAGSIAGGLVDNYFNQKASNKSYKFQKKVLQNQIQWKVADAVKAGIHPLAALGVNPASGPSVSVGSSSLGQALSDMGQNIGRAAEAYLTPEDKSAARIALLAEERAGLENDFLRAQIAGANKALLTSGSTPGISSPIPVAPGDAPVARPGYNEALQPHYGEGADVITAPWMIYDMLRTKGNMLDPALSKGFGSFIKGQNPIDLRPWFDYFGWSY